MVYFFIEHFHVSCSNSGVDMQGRSAALINVILHVPGAGNTLT